MPASKLTTGLTRMPGLSNGPAQDILVYTHCSSPLILLAFFLIAFTAHSIATASNDVVVKPSTDQVGPGGKPLPQNKHGKPRQIALDFSHARKLVFNWLSVGTILSFLGNAVVVILHAVLQRKENWWCGESVAVGGDLSQFKDFMIGTNSHISDLRRCLLLRLFPIPYLLVGHQTLANRGTFLYLACSVDSGARVPWSLPRDLH